MSKPEDKSLNTLRVLSDKKASKKQGSIVTNGGIHVDKNIVCEEEIVTEDLIVKGLSKFAGDVSIGGRFYCPDLFSFDEDTFRFRRNLVPTIPKNPISDCDISSLGTYKEPWSTAYIKCIKAENIDASTMCVGVNCAGNPSFQILPEQININNELNIVNPETNVIMLKTCNGAIESYAPIYNQWDSFRTIEIAYNPQEILHITTSTILLNINNESELFLCYDADLVPPSTKVKIYFIKQNQSTKSRYKLILTRFNKKYVFTSTVPVKRIKLIVMENSIYLIN
ncbi:putative orfan [Tupanvirus soda lake]|uniref:Orfan n=2 Tax=Tupanvirus TaxID=2094720 RepID=A0AC62ADB4_9VIRU|nr:putative orfan [Tupanvirus soda lake]QKU35588.1 putative orfan [Tupanvirus soda lake]